MSHDHAVPESFVWHKETLLCLACATDLQTIPHINVVIVRHFAALRCWRHDMLLPSTLCLGLGWKRRRYILLRLVFVPKQILLLILSTDRRVGLYMGQFRGCIRFFVVHDHGEQVVCRHRLLHRLKITHMTESRAVYIRIAAVFAIEPRDAGVCTKATALFESRRCCILTPLLRLCIELLCIDRVWLSVLRQCISAGQVHRHTLLTGDGVCDGAQHGGIPPGIARSAQGTREAHDLEARRPCLWIRQQLVCFHGVHVWLAWMPQSSQRCIGRVKAMQDALNLRGPRRVVTGRLVLSLRFCFLFPLLGTEVLCTTQPRHARCLRLRRALRRHILCLCRLHACFRQQKGIIFVQLVPLQHAVHFRGVRAVFQPQVFQSREVQGHARLGIHRQRQLQRLRHPLQVHRRHIVRLRLRDPREPRRMRQRRQRIRVPHTLNQITLASRRHGRS